MKKSIRIRVLTLCVLLLTASAPWAQQPVEVVKVKNEDRSVDISFRNSSDLPYTVTVHMELSGMVAEQPVDSGVTVEPHSEAAVCKLLAIAPKTHYKIRYTAYPSSEQAKSYTVISPEVVIYTKNGQKKSTALRIYLEKHDIPYREVNVTHSKMSKEMYSAMLDRRGLDMKKVRLPVVVYKGDVYTGIKNVEKFAKSTFTTVK